MKRAESVTFGGAGFDRAAELRDNPEALAQLLVQADCQILPFWRGKPLVEDAQEDQALQLVTLPPDHSVFAEASHDAVFLGRKDARPYFAKDISRWQPAEQDISQIGAFMDDSEQCHPALPTSQRFAELRRIMARLNPEDAELAAMTSGVFAWHRTHQFCAKCGQPSVMVSAGWQRQCPACNARHFPRTDPVVIMLVTRGNKVLLGRSPGWPEGMYSLLAGFMEPGETIETAVRREVFEETAINIGAVGYLASQPWPFPSSLMIGCWAEATSDEITIDPAEIEHAHWVTREEVLAAWSGKTETLISARKGAIAHFLIRHWMADSLD